MRVRCIHKFDKYIGDRSFWTSPVVGEVCTVNGEEVYNGEKFLFLDEYDGFSYDARCFATLDDTPAEVIEETELVTA